MRVFDFNRSILRQPGPSVVNGLRPPENLAPDVEAILNEHGAYTAALERAGVAVETLPALDAYPDGLFVEDPALVFPGHAILLRPGAESRRGEAAALRPVLEQHFDVLHELADGHVDGGDILVTPDLVLIGLSHRTDRRGARALATILERLGRLTRIVAPPSGALHLKSVATLIDEETILTTPACEAAGLFTRFRQIVVAEGEAAAANALRVNDTLLVGERFERTNARLDKEGYTLDLLPTEHIGRIDAGLTCMSLRWMQSAPLGQHDRSR